MVSVSFHCSSLGDGTHSGLLLPIHRNDTVSMVMYICGRPGSPLHERKTSATPLLVILQAVASLGGDNAVVVSSDKLPMAGIL